jgi:hypothetical protein
MHHWNRHLYRISNVYNPNPWSVPLNPNTSKLWLPVQQDDAFLHHSHITSPHHIPTRLELYLDSTPHHSYTMPRRRAGNPAAAQSTLSFGNRSRVTKPVTAPSDKAKALDSTLPLSQKSTSATPEPQNVSVSPVDSKPHVAELVVRPQPTVAPPAPRSEEDKRALKLNKQDIWRYWRAQEESRKAPRGKFLRYRGSTGGGTRTEY